MLTYYSLLIKQELPPAPAPSAGHQALSQATGWREARVRRGRREVAGGGGYTGAGILSTRMRSDPGSGVWGLGAGEGTVRETERHPMPWDKEPGSGELGKGWEVSRPEEVREAGLGCVSMQQGSLSQENSCTCQLTL